MIKELIKREWNSFAFLFMWFAFIYARFDVLFVDFVNILFTATTISFIVWELVDIKDQYKTIKSEKKDM